MNSSARLQCISLVLVFSALASVGHCLLSDSQKAQALESINHLRRNARPTPANMNNITWDVALEALAQDAANRCVFGHNYGGEYASLGEVVYQGGNSDPDYIFNFMYLERECYNFSTGACDCTQSKYPFFNTCGHYQQLVTALVTRMGCAIQSCNGNNLFFCNFNTGVAYPPYEAGPPGTKCGLSMATYHNGGLCEYYEPFSETPLPSTVDCRLNCLNNGTLNPLTIMAFCKCDCPAKYTGFRCEKQGYNAVPITDVCVAQGVKCQNGGTPTQVDTACKCVCPTNFQGDSCEVNIKQTASSIFVNLGGKVIYQSYCPMPKTIYSDDLSAKIKDALVKEVNNYCRANYAACCPKSSQIVDPFVSSSDCFDLANYPEQQIDGTLRIALFIKLSPTLALQCRGNANAYMTKTVMKNAFKLAQTNIKQIVSQVGITFVKLM